MQFVERLGSSVGGGSLTSLCLAIMLPGFKTGESHGLLASSWNKVLPLPFSAHREPT